MGTTIGINSLILLAALFYFLIPENQNHQSKWLTIGFWGVQTSLFIFLIALMRMGIIKSIWFFEEPQAPFAEMMERSMGCIMLFIISGTTLMGSFLIIVIKLMTKFLTKTISLL